MNVNSFLYSDGLIIQAASIPKASVLKASVPKASELAAAAGYRTTEPDMNL